MPTNISHRFLNCPLGCYCFICWNSSKHNTMHCWCSCWCWPRWGTRQSAVGIISKSLHQLGFHFLSFLHTLGWYILCFCLLPVNNYRGIKFDLQRSSDHFWCACYQCSHHTMSCFSMRFRLTSRRQRLSTSFQHFRCTNNWADTFHLPLFSPALIAHKLFI